MTVIHTVNYDLLKNGCVVIQRVTGELVMSVFAQPGLCYQSPCTPLPPPKGRFQISNFNFMVHRPPPSLECLQCGAAYVKISLEAVCLLLKSPKTSLDSLSNLTLVSLSCLNLQKKM